MKTIRNIFQRTIIWEKLRDKWMFDVMITGKSNVPTWLLFD